jgi:hypothetical protein
MRIKSFKITNGLISIELERYEADIILEKVSDIIRQLTRIYPNPENYIKICRAALICHKLSKPGNTVSLDNLSKEDINILYNLNLNGPILNDLSGLRMIARSCVMTMVEADQIAKDFENVMTC